MSVVLVFFAFPVVPILVAIRWLLRSARYERALIQAGLISPGTPEQFLGDGPIATYQRGSRTRARADSEVRAGQHGSDMAELLRAERSAWRAFLVAMIAGAGVALLFLALIDSADRLGVDADLAALGVLFVAAWGAITGTIIVRLGRSAAQGKRSTVVAFAGSALALLAGASIVVIWLAYR
jgi:hypothetical protein